MKQRQVYLQLIAVFCVLFASFESTAQTETSAVIKCIHVVLGLPSIVKANLPKPILQKSERIQMEGKVERTPLEDISDIHAGLIQTTKQLEEIGLRAPQMTHVQINENSAHATIALQRKLIRLREERVMYLTNNGSEDQHHSGIQRIVANHEMIHLSLFTSFPATSRVYLSGMFQEAFANFLSFHFDPETYRDQAAYYPQNLEFSNEYSMGAAKQGQKRTKFAKAFISGDPHSDGLILGYFLLRIRNEIGAYEMNNFLRSFIPALDQFSLPDSIHADLEIMGFDVTSYGEKAKAHYSDLLLALAVADKLNRGSPVVEFILRQFLEATETGMPLSRLHSIADQLIKKK